MSIKKRLPEDLSNGVIRNSEGMKALILQSKSNLQLEIEDEKICYWRFATRKERVSLQYFSGNASLFLKQHSVGASLLVAGTPTEGWLPRRLRWNEARFDSRRERNLMEFAPKGNQFERFLKTKEQLAAGVCHFDQLKQPQHSLSVWSSTQPFCLTRRCAAIL